jgi:hypothetical protein
VSFRRAGVVGHLFGETRGRSPRPRCLVFWPGMAVIDKRGQAIKGVRWMSWHREATKDAAACEKLRGAGKRALIRRCPNRETGRVFTAPVTPARTHRAGRANAGN